MSEQQNLISILNEIMEKYVDVSREEATPKLKIVAIQEERDKSRTETKQPQEESIKRKRNIEEAETKQGEEVEVDDFISARALVVMEQTFLQKDFIEKRYFNKLISPFREVIEKRCWSLLCEHKPTRFVTVVREFFANLVGKKDKMCYVRGKWISFDMKEINKTYNLK